MSAKAASSGYIIGRKSDSFFLIGAPAVALAMGIASAFDTFAVFKLFIVMSPAHLFLVLYRATNPMVFRQFPWRFTLVPALLFLAIFASPPLFSIVFYLTILWDIHHGYMQTFGIGRIYDAKRGNDPTVGRRLDMVINGLMYVGPILAGASVLRYVDVFSKFNVIDTIFFSDTVPALVSSRQSVLMWALVTFAVPFLAFYVWKYREYAKAGYKVSPQKVGLLVCTAVVSLYAWGFNPFGKAFFIQNIYHAMQYFAIVWWSERKSLASRLRVDASARGPAIALLAFLVPSIGYGVWQMSIPREAAPGFSYVRGALCAALVLEAMHFWWDGFIWSVRKKEVANLVTSSPAPPPIAPAIG